ncbi:MAG: EthD family reductase [Rhodobacter sp.]|uniref:EthD family reductase n=1 Tax=Pararhodobacter sp. TaxID=2127056 RepID=UPI002B76678F|nr:EthD family reductase [Pararhodobacter sp.]MCC0073368.1 EthD family reductase [Rhodobacter sp.]HPD91172.1 EthD family reductase [Pararhodobacter sp.]
MSFALALFYHPEPGHEAPPDGAALRSRLAQLGGLQDALIFTPAAAQDRYVDDGPPPMLGLQLHFARLEDLEAAACAGGEVQGLAGLADRAQPRVTAQAFWRRRWPVPAPWAPGRTPPRSCSYVVHYPGPARDPNAWHSHYMASHPPLFQQMPGIRGIEILTPVDWVSGLPFEKTGYLQRNRVEFDTPQMLQAALQSPVRDALRADYHNFPPYEGGAAHFPMWTERFSPAG